MQLIDLSHVIENGMVTHKGLPGPAICDFWSRESSKAHYDDGSSFQIGRIDMVANTGTYLDTPFHRFEDGEDLSDIPLERLVALPGLVVKASEPRIDAEVFEDLYVGGRAVLFHTGWDRHWRTEQYQDGHPYLTERAAQRLVDRGAALVGIDSHNVDDTSGRSRPVHTMLLGAGIPIVEHLTGLHHLPADGFTFSATPPKMKGVGTFPVRAFAVRL